MNKKYKFGIDIDGTIVETLTFYNHLNEYFQKKVNYDDITDFNLLPFYEITEEEYYEWYKIYGKTIYESSQAIVEAKEVLDQLFLHGHQLVYISAREEEYFSVTKEWFVKNDIKFDDIVLVGNYDKATFAQKFAIDIFIEDNYNNAISISNKLNILVYLINTPYNQGDTPDNIIRVNDWLDIAKDLKAKGILINGGN